MLTQSGRKRWREEWPLLAELGLVTVRTVFVIYVAFAIGGAIGDHARMIREIHQRLIPQSCTKVEVP